jgi:branched-chain amino acid transport system permease protein
MLNDALLTQQLLNGVVIGFVYALIALGYSMVYGILGFINFAHGELYMVGAFVAAIAITIFGLLGLPAPIVIIGTLVAAVGITAVYGWSVERIAYLPLRNANRLAPLLSAIGVSIFLQNFVQLTQGAEVVSVAPVLQESLTMGSITLEYSKLLMMVITALLLAGLWFLLHHTNLGRMQRAVAQDALAARLHGINSNHIIAFTFTLGAALAGVASVMHVLLYGAIDFHMGFTIGIKAFAAAVLGGTGSLPGAVLGGLLLGITESLWEGYLGADYKDVAAFLLLIGILLCRPYGIWGRADVEKV